MTVGTRHLRAFVAVATEGRITAAAQRLGLSQPAVSRTLRELEAQLGVCLVERSSHRLELTAGGRALLPKATTAIAVVDAVLSPPATPGQVRS
jgi:DNA-binding transcriptional LysR family regulator